MGKGPDEVNAWAFDETERHGHTGSGAGTATGPDLPAEAAGDNPDNAAQIRADIEQTRAEMSDTIDALQEKLSPERIKDQVKEKVKEQASDAYESVKKATVGRVEKVMDNVSEKVSDVTRGASTAVKDTGSSIVETIRQNPIPFALIGVGIGMLIKKNKGESESRYEDRRTERSYRDFTHEPDATSSTDRARETVGDAAERTRDALSPATSDARGTASGVAERTREGVEHAGAQARYRARRATDHAKDMLYSNPLAVGAAVLATGAAVGLALPTSRVEGEYLGEARDQLMDKAETVARDTVEKVKRVAGEAGREVQQEAKNQGLTASS